jgi:protein SCO1/2
MRARHATAVVLALAASGHLMSGCSRPDREVPRRFQLVGQVLAVRADGGEITIRHEDIKGFMPAMTMPFRLKDPALARGRVPGDLVRATLMVTDSEAWLATVDKTGWAPLEERADRPAAADALVKPGDLVPDQTLVDQDGRAFRLSSLRGSAVLLTFVYTRCPLPDFCPRMDAQFAGVQRAIRAGRLSGGVRLVSVSFDPDFDTPAVLKAHAAQAGADSTLWTFATGPAAQIDAWGGRLGLSVIRDAHDPSNLTHNLRTAVIDPRGRLTTILDGNRWTVDQAIAALASAFHFVEK